MMRERSRLLYQSCQKSGHEDHGLTRVCIDAKCINHQLVCCVCALFEHSGHQTIGLADFIEKLKELELSASSSIHTDPYISTLNELKSRALEHIATTKQKIWQLLAQLDRITDRYGTLERELLIKIESLHPEFKYNHTLDLSEINQQLNRAVELYIIAVKREAITTQAHPIIEQARQMTSQVVNHLDALVKSVRDSVRDICTVFGRKEQIFWSTSLKHNDVAVETQKRVTRTKKRTGQYWVCSLVDLKILYNCHWRLKILKHAKKTFIGMGIISEALATQFSFCQLSPYQQEMDNMCVITSDASDDHAFIKKVKRGKRFKFNVGDVVDFNIDLQRKELICERSPDGFCVLEVDSLMDPTDTYHPCVFLNLGDSVEIIEL